MKKRIRLKSGSICETSITADVRLCGAEITWNIGNGNVTVNGVPVVGLNRKWTVPVTIDSLDKTIKFLREVLFAAVKDAKLEEKEVARLLREEKKKKRRKA